MIIVFGISLLTIPTCSMDPETTVTCVCVCVCTCACVRVCAVNPQACACYLIWKELIT